MNILVCISQVPDTTSRISFDDEGKNLKTSDLQFIINPYDEIALSKSLVFKEQNQSNVKTILIGKIGAEATLRKTLAIGADEAVRVDADPKDAFFVATQIAAYLKDEPADLILMGAESIDYNGSEVASALSAFLQVPCVSNAKSLDIEADKLIVKREAEGGSETLEIPFPAVIGAQEGMAEARIPNMRGIMTARTKMITVRQPVAAAERIRFDRYETPSPKAPVKLIDSDQVDELAKILLREVKSM